LRAPRVFGGNSRTAGWDERKRDPSVRPSGRRQGFGARPIPRPWRYSGFVNRSRLTAISPLALSLASRPISVPERAPLPEIVHGAPTSHLQHRHQRAVVATRSKDMTLTRNQSSLGLQLCRSCRG
jgi:hypothetical protein